MKHILTCSFGKDSIATALLALQHGEPLDELVYSEVMFSDMKSCTMILSFLQIRRWESIR